MLFRSIVLRIEPCKRHHRAVRGRLPLSTKRERENPLTGLVLKIERLRRGKTGWRGRHSQVLEGTPCPFSAVARECRSTPADRAAWSTSWWHTKDTDLPWSTHSSPVPGDSRSPWLCGAQQMSYPLTPPDYTYPGSAPLMITNTTIEFAAGIKVVHEKPLVVQCGIVRIIVADSLRWKMLPTFVPGHTHCRGQHSILITPRATRKG